MKDGLPEEVCWALETGYFFIQEHIEDLEYMVEKLSDEDNKKHLALKILNVYRRDEKKYKRILEQYNLET
jgi:hypothetical protein